MATATIGPECEVAAEAGEFRVDPVEHLGLTWLVAMRYRGRGIDVEDLAAEGAVGLIKACREFNPAREIQFSTCATAYIFKEIWTALIRQANPIRIPRNVLKDVRDGLAPGMPGATEHRLESAARARRILEASRAGDHTFESGLASVVSDHRHGEEPEEEGGPLAAAGVDLHVLTPREAEVLRRNYGLDGHAPETLVGIGRSLGISKERARQLRNRALKRLRIAAGVLKPVPRGRRPKAAAGQPARSDP